MSARADLADARAASAAAGGVAERALRRHLPADPHTGRDLARKLPPLQRQLLADLYDRLCSVERRLDAIAARHGEQL